MSRIQLALNVDDLDASIAFYSTLFGTEPAKTARVRQLRRRRAAAEAVLIENPGQGGSLNHLGVEVADTDTRRRRADPARRRRLCLHRRARHHLLLRQAGQVLGGERAR
jgi:catechol 2,3-dioxygenase-like lactoylglutathione lyase family enzyme